MGKEGHRGVGDVEVNTEVKEGLDRVEFAVVVYS